MFMIQNPFNHLNPAIQPVKYQSKDYQGQDIAFNNLHAGKTKSIENIVDNSMTDRVLKQAALVAEGDKELALKHFYYARNKYEAAAKIGDHENPLTPYTLASRLKLASIQMKIGNLDEARINLERMPRENRNSDDTRLALAHIYEELYNTSQSASVPVKYNPMPYIGNILFPLLNVHAPTQVPSESIPIETEIAIDDIFKDKDYLTKALDELEAIVKKSPADTKVLNFLGHLYDKKGDVKKAILNYHKSYELEPTESISNRLKVLYRIQAGKEHNPDFKRAHMYTQVAPLINEGIDLEAAGNLEEAHKKYEEALLLAGIGIGIQPNPTSTDPEQDQQVRWTAIATMIKNGQTQKNPDYGLVLEAYRNILDVIVQDAKNHNNLRVISQAIQEMTYLNRLYPMKKTSEALADYHNAFAH